MSFMDKLRGSTPSERAGEKSTYAKAYDEEKAMIAREREEGKQARADERLKRAGEKARKDARNPLYQRIAKKVGASGKAAVGAVAADIGKKKARMDAEREVLGKVRRQARMSEMSKIAVHQEREKVRAKMQPGRRVGSSDLLDVGNILGGGKGGGLSLDGMTPDLGMGSSKKKKKKSGKDDFFNGML